MRRRDTKRNILYYFLVSRYDLGKMEDTMKNKVPKFGNPENACIDTRVELAKCYNGVDDVRKCDGFVEALERCANQAVISS